MSSHAGPGSQRKQQALRALKVHSLGHSCLPNYISQNSVFNIGRFILSALFNVSSGDYLRLRRESHLPTPMPSTAKAHAVLDY